MLHTLMSLYLNRSARASGWQELTKNNILIVPLYKENCTTINQHSTLQLLTDHAFNKVKLFSDRDTRLSVLFFGAPVGNWLQSIEDSITNMTLSTSRAGCHVLLKLF